MADRLLRAPSASIAPPRARSPEEALDRLQALETRVAVYEERTDNRLSQGAATIGELKGAVVDLRPKRGNLLGASLALAVAGIVFAAGRYPDRTELEHAQDRAIDAVEPLRVQLHALERELVRLRTAMEALEARVSELRQQMEIERQAGARRRKP
jgi:phage shock protein A